MERNSNVGHVANGKVLLVRRFTSDNDCLGGIWGDLAKTPEMLSIIMGRHWEGYPVAERRVELGSRKMWVPSIESAAYIAYFLPKEIDLSDVRLLEKSDEGVRLETLDWADSDNELQAA